MKLIFSNTFDFTKYIQNTVFVTYNQYLKVTMFYIFSHLVFEILFVF